MSETLTEPMPRRTKKPVVSVASGPQRLRSLTCGGDNPGTGIFLPGAGEIFEADAAGALALIACGLAEAVTEKAEG